MIKNVNWFSCKVLVTLVRADLNLDFPYEVWQNTQISNSIKIRPMGALLFHAERRTDGWTRRICERA